MKRWIVLMLLLMSATSFAQLSDVKIVCFNIRYDNKSDGEFAWNKRREAVVRMFADEKPAIIGMQEVLKSQLDYLKKQMPTYSSIGVGRDDGATKGEYAPIFYDTKTLELIKSGHFWLSDTPNCPSKGWDAACERIATWSVFRERSSGKEFICINTHFDHVGEKARENSGRQMLDSIKVLAGGLPAVIMGDFNTTTDHPSLSPLLSATTDARSAKVEFGDQPKYTYIGFSPDTEKCLIDHIFVQGFDVEEYRINQNGYGIKQLSDHLPVICVLSL